MIGKTPSDGAHIIVIGGGVIGAAAAVRLQDGGARISLVDPGDAKARASFGNAGIIANELADPLASWATVRAAPRRMFGADGPLDFVWRDVGLWGPWALRLLVACRPDRFRAGRAALEALLVDAAPAWRRLLDDIGRPELLRAGAHWAVWEAEDTRARGGAAVKAGASAAIEIRDLASQEMEAIRREVSRGLVGGVAFEGAGSVTDPNAVVSALHERLQSRGGAMIAGRVRAVDTSDDGAVVELEDGRRLSGDLALVAAGARSAPLVRRAGLIAPLVAERGYHLQYADHDFAASTPSLVLEDRFICVVQIGDAVRVTGFTEIGSPDSPPDPRKWARLRRHVAELGLPVRGEPSQWMGARPTLPDFVPAIGRWGRLLYAFGHQHIGVTLAATTAEAVAELAQSGGTPARLRPDDLRRFS